MQSQLSVHGLDAGGERIGKVLGRLEHAVCRHLEQRAEVGDQRVSYF